MYSSVNSFNLRKNLSFILLSASLLSVTDTLAANKYFNTTQSGSAWDQETTLNWATSSNGIYDQAWVGNDAAFFEGTGGPVNVTGTVDSIGVTFNSDAYVLSGGELAFSGNRHITVTNAAHTATINSAITFTGTNAYFDKRGAGTLELAGTTATSSYIRIQVGGLLVSGGTHTAATGGLAIAASGGSGANTYTQTGGILNAPSINIADQARIGVMNLSGGSVNTNMLYVSVRGTATLNISDTGILNAGTVSFGHSGGANGTGTLNLDGGILAADIVAKNRPGTVATFNFNGGTLRASASSQTNFLSGLDTANVRNGGAVIDTNGRDITIAQALLHSSIGGDNAIDGGLTKKGDGSLTLSAANTYTGATAVENGVLVLASTGSIAASSGIHLATESSVFDTQTFANYTIDTDQTLSGNGIVITGGTLTVAGTLAPGNSTGTLFAVGNVVLQEGAMLLFEIGTDGAHDTLNFILPGSTLTLEGDVNLVLAVAEGALEQSYTLFGGSGLTINGPGSFNVSFDGIEPAHWNWNPANGTLSIIPESSTYAFAGLAALGLLVVTRRKKSS